MCKPASGWATRDKVYWQQKPVTNPDEIESHRIIAEEHGLHIDGARGANAVAFEITPANNDFTLPLEQWVFRIDDGFPVPDWADAAEIEARAREVLPEWLAAKVVLPGEMREKVDSNIIACYGTIQAVEGGTIQAVRGGTIQAVRGGTIQAVRGGTIQAVWGGTIQAVRGGTIQAVWGGTIQAVWGGTIQAYTPFDRKLLTSSRAVLIDRSGDKVKCYVGKDK